MKAEQLRAALLQQAVQGKLVPQRDDEPTVEQIGDAPDDVPFAIPEKWKWISLKGVVIPAKQKKPDCDFFYVDVSSIDNARGVIAKLNKVSKEQAPSRARKIIETGMVLFATIRPYLKNICVIDDVEDEVIASTAFASMLCKREILDNHYLYFVLRSNYFEDFVKSKQKGVAYPAISDKDFYSAVIPLPPLAEQRRIVARLNELLPLVDAYGKEQDALEKIETALPDQLRASLLQEAVQGKLVPQRDDEPAVEQIGDAPEDVPFAIPEKWMWIELGELLSYGRCEQTAPEDIGADDWVLDLEDIEKGTGRLLAKKSGIVVKSNKNKFYRGDVLYGKLRPYLNKVIIADQGGFCTTEIVPLNVSDAKFPISSEYLKVVLMSPYFVNYANQCSYGVKMPRLGTKDAKRAFIPLPPFSEQRRIVARLNELLPMVDKLAARSAA